MIALGFAAGATVCFAVRDNIVRALHAHASPLSAAAATLLAGTLVAAVYTRRAPSPTELRRMLPAGVLFGLSYICLFEAYFHGRVSVVSPLVGTESLWGVGSVGPAAPQDGRRGEAGRVRRSAGRRRRGADRRLPMIAGAHPGSDIKRLRFSQ